MTRPTQRSKPWSEESKDRAVSGAADNEGVNRPAWRAARVMMLVPAGDPVDSVVKDLLPHLDEGDASFAISHRGAHSGCG